MPDVSIKIYNKPRTISVNDNELTRINLNFVNPFSSNNANYVNTVIPKSNTLGLIAGHVMSIDSNTGDYKVCNNEQDQALGLLILTHSGNIEDTRIQSTIRTTTLFTSGSASVDVYETHSIDGSTELVYQPNQLLYCSPFGLLTNEENLTSQSRPLGIVEKSPTQNDKRMHIILFDFVTNPNYDDSGPLTINPSSLPFLSLTNNVLSLGVGEDSNQVATGNHTHNYTSIIGLTDDQTGYIENNLLPPEVFGVDINQYGTEVERDASTPKKGDVAKVYADPDPNKNSTYFYDGSSWVESTTSNKVDVSVVSNLAERALLNATEGDIAKVIGDPNPNNNGVYTYTGSSWTLTGLLRPIQVVRFNTVSDRDLVFTNPNEGDMAIVNQDPIPSNNRVYVWDADTSQWYSTGDGIVNPISVTIHQSLSDRDSLFPAEGDIAIVQGDSLVYNNGAYIWEESTNQWYKIESTTINWQYITNIPSGLVIDSEYIIKKPLWDLAYEERGTWNGSSINLNPALGRASLELGNSAVLDVGTNSNQVAAGNHVHGLSEVSNLTDILNSKSDLGHNHLISDVVSLTEILDSKVSSISLHNPVTISGNGLVLNEQELSLNIGTEADQVAAGDHTHGIADIVSLQDKLDLKADTSQSHNPVTVSGNGLVLNDQELQVDFGNEAGKVSEGNHEHPLIDVIGLLDGQGKINSALLPTLSPVRVEVINTIAERDALTGLVEGVFAIVTQDPNSELNGTYIYDAETSWVKSSTSSDWSAITNKPVELLYTTNVIDNLTSIHPDLPLSANQGRILNENLINKADRPELFTIGHFGVFDNEGDMVDSSYSPSSFELADITILKESNVIDTLLSTDVDQPLSANQGKVLKSLIDDINVDLSSKVDKIGVGYENNLPIFTVDGGVQDSGISVGDLTFHNPVTINPISDPYLTIAGNQQITLNVGTSNDQVAAGNHTHSGLINLDGSNKNKLIKTDSSGTSLEFIDANTVSNISSYILDPFEGEYYILNLETEAIYNIFKVGVRCLVGNCDVELIYNPNSGSDLTANPNNSIIYTFSNVDNSSYRNIDFGTPFEVPNGSVIGIRVFNTSNAEKLALVVHYSK